MLRKQFLDKKDYEPNEFTKEETRLLKDFATLIKEKDMTMMLKLFVKY